MIDAFDYDRPEKADLGSIRLASGLYVDPFDVPLADIKVSDIAHGLSMQCRFAGHVRSYYSVAEHSVYVARQLQRQHGDPRLSLFGLLHDAEEAYMPDMVRPIKLRPEMKPYVEAGETLRHRIWQKVLGDSPGEERQALIDEVDNGILPWEMAMFRDVEGTRFQPYAAEQLFYAALNEFHKGAKL